MNLFSVYLDMNTKPLNKKFLLFYFPLFTKSTILVVCYALLESVIRVIWLFSGRCRTVLVRSNSRSTHCCTVCWSLCSDPRHNPRRGQVETGATCCTSCCGPRKTTWTSRRRRCWCRTTKNPHKLFYYL